MKRKMKMKPVAILWDNCSIHRALLVRNAAKELKITLIMNVAYRPDIMGIERYWKLAKLQYRKRLSNKLAQEAEFDQLQMVTESLKAVTDMQAKKNARNGIKSLMKAKPVPRSYKDEDAGESNLPKVSDHFKDKFLN